VVVVFDCGTDFFAEFVVTQVAGIEVNRLIDEIIDVGDFAEKSGL
jgi:hypothetical protein